MNKMSIVPSKEFDIPTEMKEYDPYSLDSTHNKDRREWIEKGTFCFVSWRWVIPLAKWIGSRKCLEVIAGRGVLSYALRSRGVSVISTDNFSFANNVPHEAWKETITEVEKLDAVESVLKYGRDIDVLIMSWPYGNGLATKVLEALYDVNPSALVIYIGEDAGGCNAEGEFFCSFEESPDEGFQAVAELYQRWPLLSDKLMLGRYNPDGRY